MVAKLTTCMLMLVVVGVLGAADAPRDNAAKVEKLLQGNYTAVSVESNGAPVPDTEVATHKLKIEGNRISIMIGDQGGSHELTIDPTRKPNAIDVGNLKGIYELKDGTLKLCYSLQSSGERPREFATKRGSEVTCAVWKRVNR